jgi:hypothetical protein
MLASETHDFHDSLTEEQKLLESDSVLTYDRYYAQVDSSNAQIDQPIRRQELGLSSSDADALDQGKISFE